MLELNARNFVSAVTELRQIQVFIANIADKTMPLGADDRNLLKAHTGRMIDAIEAIGSRSAYRSAERLSSALHDESMAFTYPMISGALADIESRFADHLDDIILFVIPDQQASLFRDASDLMGDDEIVYSFPSVTRELEEASKCLALSRPTASAFHSMRMLEIGIAALAKHLNIPDPIKATDRSWGNVLENIKLAIDAQFPRKHRVSGSQGSELEALYVTLDAVKNPWRNATMHVEAVYTEADAQHILSCCMAFFRKLMELCDEYGLPLASSREAELDLSSDPS